MRSAVFGELARGDDPDEGWIGRALLPTLVEALELDTEVQPLQLVVEDEKGEGPSPEQEDAYRLLQEREPQVSREVLRALFEYYQGHRPEYVAWLGEERAPAIERPAELCGMVSFDHVIVRRSHDDGSAYVAFLFFAEFADDEHGLGVLTHRGRVLQAGQFDVALLTPGEPADPDVEPLLLLVDAIQNDDQAHVDELIGSGVDVNALTEAGEPLLSIAVEGMDLDLVERLLALGARPDVKGLQGRTPLARAEEMVARLDPAAVAELRLMQKGDPAAFARLRATAEKLLALLRGAGGE